MAYYAMNEQQAVEYVKTRTNIFSPGAELTCREIGDGNLNLVFIMRETATGKSVIVKQALNYAKVVGESWPLTLDRARIESEALILQATRVPDLVPHVYSYDAELALTVMEDLSDHVIMRKGLIEGNRYPLFAEHISTFLAHTLFFSTDLALNPQQKKQRVQQFINIELCKITEDLIFEHPYRDAETNQISVALRPTAEALWADQTLLTEAAILREQFLTKAEALLHGDLHTGSIFIKPDSTKVIDPEFAFYGPIGFDLGAVIGNLLLNYAGQQGWQTDASALADYRQYLLDTVHQIWVHFAEKFTALWDAHGTDFMANATSAYRQQYMLRLLQQSFGYAGCKMVRRVIGLAKVADIETIADEAVRLRAQQQALAVGSALVRGHRRLQSVEDALQLIRHAAQAGAHTS